MRKTPLRRRRLFRPWLRDEADKVTSEQVAETLRRWGGCILARIERDHECRDAFGTPHAPTDLHKLTMEHIKMELMAGKRGDRIVPMCWAGNLRPPTKEQRAAIRALLAD